MTSPNDAFIGLFERFSATLNRLADLPESRKCEIDEACRRHPRLEQHRRRLLYIRDLRHLLQHPQTRGGGAPFQIGPAFVEETAELLRRIENPPTAMKLGVSRAQIRTASPEERIGDLAAEMKEKGYSHLPILDERDVVRGVFNEAAVFDSLWAPHEPIIERSMRLGEIMAHCSLDAQHTETFRFIDPRQPLDAVLALFLAVATPTTRVGVVFVTASGKRSDPLQRLITPWDVMVVSRDWSEQDSAERRPA